MATLFLKISHQGKLLKIKPFTEDQISIGSNEGLSLQLQGLSPWHFLIEKKGDRYILFDLGSEAGTLIAGSKVEGEKEIQSGELIQAGEYTLQFFVGVPKETGAQAPTPAPTPDLAPPESFEVPTVAQDESEKEEEQEMPVAQAPTKQSKAPVNKSSFVPKKGKGFWKTFAPANKLSDLDSFIEPSIGNFIEVILAWKGRILSSQHFAKGEVYIGAAEDCDVQVPHSLPVPKYKILDITKEARVIFDYGVKGKLFQGRDKTTRTSINIDQPGPHSLLVKPYEMIRMDLNDSLQLYIRIKNKPEKAMQGMLLSMNLAEWSILFFSFLLTGLLVFYGAFYSSIFLTKDDVFVEENLRQAVIRFTQIKPQQIEKNLGNKNKVAKQAGLKPKKKKRVIPKRKRPKALAKSAKPKKPAPKPVKIATVKPKGKTGAAGGLRGNKNKIKRSGSLRPGGSLKTGKQGSSVKTKAPDPTKSGLLGVFGGGGSLTKLDKGSTGSSRGGLVGLAQDSTGAAGTKESYSGEGIGTSTKTLGSGGKGNAIQGIAGIKTKGRGDFIKGQGEGSLGTRGRMSIDIGEDDIDVDGEIDREGILRVIKQNHKHFDRCYQFSLQKDPQAEGNLNMGWDILANGSVRRVKVLSDGVKSTYLSECISGVLRTLKFPQPPSGQVPRISFKFVFSR